MKALALFSGGLDSTLAIKVILEQGIEVIALNFLSPFCCCEKKNGCGSSVKNMAGQLGVEFKRIYLGEDYLEMIKNPRHGYGKNLNPCIDCRIFKFRRAKDLMSEVEASFIISGEVLGQRPMSQHRSALEVIEKEAGLKGLILRPLCAKLFPLTLPEEKGWVKRENLLAIAGRSRKNQIHLASSFGIRDYPCPAGGCLLTDRIFSKRLNDFFEFDEISINNAGLLRLGRHFRMSPEFKLVVGRDEKENAKLFSLTQEGDLQFEPKEVPGPFGLARGKYSDYEKDLCAQIIARYTSLSEEVRIVIKNGSKDEEIISTRSIDEEKYNSLKV